MAKATNTLWSNKISHYLFVFDAIDENLDLKGNNCFQRPLNNVKS